MPDFAGGAQRVAGQDAAAARDTEGKRPVGRPPGKRSREDHKTRTYVLHTPTVEQCEDELRRFTRKPDFSEFLNGLMQEWLRRQGADR